LRTRTSNILGTSSHLNALSSLGWQVESGQKGLSVGEYVAMQLYIPADEASNLIDFGSVQLDGRAERNPKRRLAGGEYIKVFWPRHGIQRYYEISIQRILFHDQYLLAYNKESGVPSQQIPADAYNNLFAGLHRFLAKQIPKPYVALHHRLDRETTGVILFAIHRSVNRELGNTFKNHNVHKDYLAWVEGCPKRDEWISTDDIGRKQGRYMALPRGLGKPAETSFRVLHRENEHALIWARPTTGRTHQIRLHLLSSGHPVVGDRLYGKEGSENLYLHAYRLSLIHPATAEPLVLTAPIPVDWPAPAGVNIPDEMP